MENIAVTREDVTGDVMTGEIVTKFCSDWRSSGKVL
jgi:hypothetical protein